MAVERQEAGLPKVRYRVARGDDLRDVARVYLRAFPESLRELRSPHLTPLAVADIMRAPMETDPGCVLVATAAGEVVGYVVAVTDAGQVLQTALLRGLVGQWLWSWVRGRYRLSARGAFMLLRDMLRVRDAWQSEEQDCPARIISLAVAPDWQRQGIGRRLMELALQRLRELGRLQVRLEVRPEAGPARYLCEAMGFAEVRRVSGRRGVWIVMMGRTAEG
jgi:ribosomal protein S18 acetylase RimI-like enzyme